MSVIPDRSPTKPAPDADYYEFQPEFSVYSFTPSPPGTVKPLPSTQVHVHIGTPPGPVAVMRVKNAATLDALIDALVKHREDVWGKREVLKSGVGA